MRRSGLPGIEAAKQRRMNVSNSNMAEKYAAYERVANTHARTLGGILAKLALIAPDVEESASEFSAELGASEPILFSVAVDFKALKAGEART